MATSREHFNYADALIASGIKAFGSKGKKAKRRDMINGATGAAKASFSAAVSKDKKLRPNSPKGWNSATADKINKNIEAIVWKELKASYKRVSRKKKTDLHDVFGNKSQYAMLLGLGSIKKPNTAVTQKGISRRSLLLGISTTSAAMILYGTNAAYADNKSLIRSVVKDIKAYVKSKRKAIDNKMAAAIK